MRLRKWHGIITAMKKYDLTLMVPASVSGEEQKKLETKIEKLVKALDGKLGKMAEMGKKQLAYKIGKVLEAAFFNWSVELPAPSVVQLSKKLTVDHDIIRYLLVVSD